MRFGTGSVSEAEAGRHRASVTDPSVANPASASEYLLVGRGQKEPQTRRIREKIGGDAFAVTGRAMGFEIDELFGGRGGTLSSSMKT